MADAGRIEKIRNQRNVVDPELIIEIYGADTARLFMLSDSPPERDMEWTESGGGERQGFLNVYGGWPAATAFPLVVRRSPTCWARPQHCGWLINQFWLYRR